MRYSYDALNRLTREDNSLLDKTFLYEYDLAGNITKVTECAYTLGDSPTPVHLLTYSYDSRQQLTGITGLPALNASSGNCSVSGYDPAGNPLSYRGASLNWFRGRMLKNCTLPGGTNLTYAYDSNGIRVSKTVNDTTHTYFTEGSRIRAEKRTYGQTSPETPVVLPLSDVYTYIYDASGITGMSLSPSGASSSSAAYFFLKNQQGDIKFIVDGNGNTLNEYVYDAWGNHKIYKYLNGTILTDSSETPIDISSHSDYTNDIGNVNPFRYRSYYFDNETGWYYLQSRYYDPQTRRFLNADDPSVPLADQATLFGGLNLYSYCLNNPVNMVDPNGKSIFVGIILGLFISLGVEFLGDYLDDDTINRNLSSYIGAGLSGLIGGMGTSLISTMLFAGLGNVVGGLIAQDFSNPNQAMLAFFLGALVGGVSYGIGKGIQTSLAKGKYYKIIGKASENIVINKRLANAGFKGVKIGRDGIDAVLEKIIKRNFFYKASKDFFTGLSDFGFGTAGELLGF